MRKHNPCLLILIGALVLIFGTAGQTLGAQRGYLQTYKQDNFRDLTKVRFLNVVSPRSAADYVAWPEGEKDPVLSLRYRLPVGWYVCLYKGEKKDVSQHKCWAGTGREESVTKESIPEFLHEQVTGHYYHR
jgi:hypothetical protein